VPVDGVLERAVTTCVQHRGFAPDPYEAVFTAASAVPPGPFLDRLAAATTDLQRRCILEYALLIHGAGAVDVEGTALPRLLDSTDLRVRARAALVMLLVTPPNHPLRGRATQVVGAALAAADDGLSGAEGVASDVGRLRGQAAPLVDLLARRAEAKGAYRAFTFRALGEIGPAAIAHLGCKQPDCVSQEVIHYVASLGVKGRPATEALIGAAVRTPELLRDVGHALVAIAAQPAAASWRQLRERYQRACKDAGAVAFFDLNRDDVCFEVAHDLEHIAAQNGLVFKEAGEGL
jgi:hypothetical protein